jgi:hypothetical protein
VTWEVSAVSGKETIFRIEVRAQSGVRRYRWKVSNTKYKDKNNCSRTGEVVGAAGDEEENHGVGALRH